MSDWRFDRNMTNVDRNAMPTDTYIADARKRTELLSFYTTFPKVRCSRPFEK